MSSNIGIKIYNPTNGKTIFDTTIGITRLVAIYRPEDLRQFENNPTDHKVGQIPLDPSIINEGGTYFMWWTNENEPDGSFATSDAYECYYYIENNTFYYRKNNEGDILNIGVFYASRN